MRSWLLALAGVLLALPAFAQDSRDLSRDKTLYVVGYAHLDTQWRWDYPTTIQHYIPATLRQNFALFEKYPQYVFNFTGSIRYEMMEEYYPKEFARLAKYVESGQWRVVGSSVDEGDANVPSPESMIRQILYGNEYFRDTFGREGTDFLLPDCFGFPASLPSVFAHCGLAGFATQKLTWGSAVGVPFNLGVWEGPDGESIVAALNPGAYVHRLTSDLSRDPKWVERIELLGESSGVFADYHFYGVGDRGGAPDAESVEWLIRSIESDGPLDVVAAPSDQIFNDLTDEQRARLPRYQGDLLLTEHSAGTLTSQTAMKRWNRKNELLADAAERFSTFASWRGVSRYPYEELRRGWMRVLASQMHDILPGTSIPSAYDYSWNDEILGLNTFADVLTRSVGGIARTLDTNTVGRPVVVTNPLAFEREDPVEVTLTYETPPTAVRVFGPDDEEVPSQIVARSSDSLTVVFIARVPGVSTTVFDIRRAETPFDDRGVTVTARSLENEKLRVELDDAGNVVRIYDKANEKEALAAPVSLVLIDDAPAQWPAWNMDWKDLKAEPRTRVGGPARIRVLESGPVRGVVEIVREADGSRFTERLRLHRGAAGGRLEYDTEIDWHTAGSCLKVHIPLAHGAPEATYDLGLGTIRRANNDPKKYEVPSHQWFDVSADDRSYGVAVLDDSRFGSDKPADNVVRLTLVRTPVCNSYGDQATQDFGVHEVLYALAPHAGDWRRGNVPRHAARLNQPLRAFEVSRHPGSTRRENFFGIDSPHVLAMAIKRAQKSDEIVIRLRETHGLRTRTNVTFPAVVKSVRELDGQERRRSSDAKRKLVGNRVELEFTPYQVRTIAVRLAPEARGRAPVGRPLRLSFDHDAVSQNGYGDGAFDAAGRAIPAEMLPSRLRSGDVLFRLGLQDADQKNCVVARGQSISVPAGTSRVELLVGSNADDRRATFTAGDRKTTHLIPSWTDFVGLWDRRIWEGETMLGLEPGFIKRTPVAWFATHRHLADGSDDPYRFSYLFRVGIDIPEGVRSFELPNDPAVHVFAATAVSSGNHDARPTAPLYDTLDYARSVSPPYIAGAGDLGRGILETGWLIGSAEIELATSTDGAAIHFTTDGSDPTRESPKYTTPITVTAPSVLRARAYKDGMPESRALVQEFRAAQLRPADLPLDTARSPGVAFDYYEIESQRRLPAFDTLTPTASGFADTFDIGPRQRDDDFAFRFRGYFRAPRDGVYLFAISSDDGSRLEIGGRVVVDHDGLHGASERRGAIPLAAGWHAIEVGQFERGGDEALDVWVEGPAQPRHAIAKDELGRPGE